MISGKCGGEALVFESEHLSGLRGVKSLAPDSIDATAFFRTNKAETAFTLHHPCRDCCKESERVAQSLGRSGSLSVWF